MKKFFLLLVTLLFLLSGCSRSESNETSVNNPYEIAKGTSILSYYDTEDSIDTDSFGILKLEPKNIIGIDKYNKNCLIIKDKAIRCIYIVDKDIVTYNQISVGDNVDKIKKTYNKIRKLDNIYYVLFDNNNTEEDSTNQNKEDTWIWITYFTDGSKITSIKICDVLYASEFR